MNRYSTPKNSDHWDSLIIYIKLPTMSTTRKKHSIAFKAQVPIETILEVEMLSKLSKRFNVHPQIISNWKREFLSCGSETFSTKAPDEEAAKREKALYEKIGHLDIEVVFLQEGFRKSGDTKVLKEMESPRPDLSIHRSNLYYKPAEENHEDLGLIRKMDEEYLAHHTKVVLGMVDYL